MDDTLQEESMDTSEGVLADTTVGDTTIGDETIGDATIGDAAVGDNTVGDEAIGDNTAGDDTVGDEANADATIGDATVDDATVGDDTVGEANGDATVGDDTVGDDTVGEANGDATVGDATVDDATVGDETVAESTQLNETLTPADKSGKLSDKLTAKPPPAPRSSKRSRTTNASKSGPTPKRKRQSTAVTNTAADSGQLFDIILEGKGAMQSVVGDWVKRYQSDTEEAMLELVQFFVRSCGCKAIISRSDFQDKDASAVIRVLTENFAEDSGDYPLVLTGALYKKFRVNFSEFVERLISECGETILYDESMLETMAMWLIGLSDSQVRAFRHTSTLACLKLVTGLVKVANSITQDTDNTQRQYDTERKKSVSKRATGKLQKLESNLKELQQQLNEVQEMMNTLFASVFIHRYRDTCSDIRSICIQELGVWMREHYKMFLSDGYLKYIGWTLSDKVGEVRLQAVHALIPLYSSTELAPHLELFTQKFKKRFVSMRLDKEDAVQVAAINMSGQLLALDMLDPEECIEICEMVFLDNKKNVLQAAGSFASQYLFSEDFLSKERRSKPPKGHKKPTDAQIKVKELVRFFLEANLHEHTTYFVESLWDHTEVLQDWETLVSILTDSTCGVVLSSEGERVLIDIIAYGVKKTSSMATQTGKGRGKALSAKDRRAMVAGKEMLASTLIPVLPELIGKYGTDVSCAANLISIPQHFDMEMYVEMRAQKHLEEMLDHLKQLILKHSTDEVLNEISCVYKHMLSPDVTLHSVVDIAFGQLTDELFSNCKQCVETLAEENYSDESDDDVYNLAVNLKRVAALFKQVDLTKWGFIDELLKLIDMGVDGNAADTVVVPALTVVHLHLLWSLHDLDSSNPDRASMRGIHSLTDKLVKNCQDLVKLGSPEGQKQAYILLCDLLIVFSKQLKTRGPLGALVYSPEPLLQSTMCEYVMDKVFREAEEDTDPTTEEEAFACAEKLSNRRTLLAGFLKLLMFSVVEPSVGVSVLGQFVKYMSDYGDLIKKALGHIREHNPLKWYKTVLLTLQHEYTTLQDEGDGMVDHRSAEWADLKDLARRIALTTGFDLIKCRHSIVCIHREGIRYALQDYDKTESNIDDCAPPSHLDFLEVLSEFSFRLLPIDRAGEKGILVFLNDQLGEGVLDSLKTNDEWRSLKIYTSSLDKNPVGGGEDNEVGGVVTAGGKKGGKGTKRKQQFDKEKQLAPVDKSLRLEAPEV